MAAVELQVDLAPLLAQIKVATRAIRVGVERGQPFEGQSLIVSYTGWPVAGPASRDKEEIVIADVALGEARRARNWNAFNQVLRDRRSDVYDEMLGSDVKRGWY